MNFSRDPQIKSHYNSFTPQVQTDRIELRLCYQAFDKFVEEVQDLWFYSPMNFHQVASNHKGTQEMRETSAFQGSEAETAEKIEEKINNWIESFKAYYPKLAQSSNTKLETLKKNLLYRYKTKHTQPTLQFGDVKTVKPATPVDIIVAYFVERCFPKEENNNNNNNNNSIGTANTKKQINTQNAYNPLKGLLSEALKHSTPKTPTARLVKGLAKVLTSRAKQLTEKQDISESDKKCIDHAIKTYIFGKKFGHKGKALDKVLQKIVASTSNIKNNDRVKSWIIQSAQRVYRSLLFVLVEKSTVKVAIVNTNQNKPHLESENKTESSNNSTSNTPNHRPQIDKNENSNNAPSTKSTPLKSDKASNSTALKPAINLKKHTTYTYNRQFDVYIPQQLNVVENIGQVIEFIKNKTDDEPKTSSNNESKIPASQSKEEEMTVEKMLEIIKHRFDKPNPQTDGHGDSAETSDSPESSSNE